MIVYTEPYRSYSGIASGVSVCFVPDAIAIDAVQLVSQQRGIATSDVQALEDFKAVHGGETIEQTIEKMAKAMYEATYDVDATRWKDAAQESWRHKARAALRALDVL